MLEYLLRQSPWLHHQEAIHSDIHLNRLKSFRLIYHENTFLKYVFQDGVYIVTGPRQIGKSTHLKMLIQKKITQKNHKNFLYFNCDLLDSKKDIVALVETYLTQFPSKNRRYIILDEITSVKDSFIGIKFLIDAGHFENLTYILTGSNTIGIKKTGEFLPGRRGKGIDFYFSPISFKDFVQLQYPQHNLTIKLNHLDHDFFSLQHQIPFKSLLDDYLMTGGFPRVINEFYQNGGIGDDIFSIYRSWIASEIAKSDKKEYIVKCILERSILSLSADVSYNAMAQDAGIGSHNTVYDYLEFLTSAFVLSLIYNFDIHQKHVNFKKNKKIYFNDPFIYAVVEAWISAKPKQDFSYLKQSILKSKLIENLVFIKLSQMYSEVYFYRNRHEIDFVTSNYLIEVKYQKKIDTNDYKSLINPDYKAILVSQNKIETKGDILFLPIEYFLLCDSSAFNI